MIALLFLASFIQPNGATDQTPTMGWMAWQVFRCKVDCRSEPNDCVSEDLFLQQAKHLSKDGYLDAGYERVHIDDCWTQKSGRDPTTHKLVADPDRFPHGIAWLADQVHSMGVGLAIYGDIGTKTCGGYPGTAGFEKLDAQTFADWKVDYLKLDGCYANETQYEYGYAAVGDALIASGRSITYSCSWPAYLGSDETTKPFYSMISAHCNSWRNWDDVQPSWASLDTIIEHFGNYSQALQPFTGPGYWHDMDMLLAGTVSSDYSNHSPLPTLVETTTQMAIWCVMASPLIMGNDLRSVPEEAKAILLNKKAIAVNQDTTLAGIRIQAGSQQIWYRHLSDNSLGVVLYNRDSNAPVPITVQFSQLRLAADSSARIEGIFNSQDVDEVIGHYTSKPIPMHGVAFIRVYPL